MAECNTGAGQGKLFVVGTGPGGLKHLTPAARDAIAGADTVVGYRTYLDLIPELLTGKEVLSSEMMKEVDRCRKSLALAAGGKKVALVSGGDPGIYAMAGLAFEMAREQGTAIPIEVIPGIAALNACAARLGAPLMHDFAAISLSDLLTPWEVIEKRLAAAAAADFVIVIYNPKSKRRTDQIARAREIIASHRSLDTPVGIVTAATRETERVAISTLGRFLDEEISMQSSVIIGNSNTFQWGDYLVTPRGYSSKYRLK
ncbi:precorrin-3B C(17)-methyltransferase [Thiovibrio sp. JS02]